MLNEAFRILWAERFSFESSKWVFKDMTFMCKDCIEIGYLFTTQLYSFSKETMIRGENANIYTAGHDDAWKKKQKKKKKSMVKCCIPWTSLINTVMKRVLDLKMGILAFGDYFYLLSWVTFGAVLREKPGDGFQNFFLLKEVEFIASV